jgi:hypothetical protein
MSEPARTDEGKQAAGYTRKDAWRDVTFGLVIVLAVAAAYFIGRNRRASHMNSLAQCLTARQAKMYGAYWCPHCADQKQVFGAAFPYISYIECGVPGSHTIISAECVQARIRVFPTWQFADGSRHEGVWQAKDLGQKTGCAVP